jgi:hypothetical protein
MARPGEKSETPGVELEPQEMESLINKDRNVWNDRAQAFRAVGLEMLKASDAKDAKRALRGGRSARHGVRELPQAVLVSEREDPGLPDGRLRANAGRAN